MKTRTLQIQNYNKKQLKSYMQIGNLTIEKNRVIKLLKAIKTELSKENTLYNRTGICQALRRIQPANNCTHEESCFIMRYLNLHKPTADNDYKEFMIAPYWGLEYRQGESDFWWSEIYLYPETRQIRIDYLTKLIDNFK